MRQATGHCLIGLVLLGAPSRSQDVGRSADKQPKVNDFLFEVQPPVIAPGETALLRWSSKGATKVLIEEASKSTSQLHEIGTFGGNGSLKARPKEDRTYVINCEGQRPHALLFPSACGHGSVSQEGLWHDPVLPY